MMTHSARWDVARNGDCGTAFCCGSRWGKSGLQIQDGLPVAADLVYEGIANQRRGGADTMTKILFQYYARREPITIEGDWDGG